MRSIRIFLWHSVYFGREVTSTCNALFWIELFFCRVEASFFISGEENCMLPTPVSTTVTLFFKTPLHHLHWRKNINQNNTIYVDFICCFLSIPCSGPVNCWSVHLLGSSELGLSVHWFWSHHTLRLVGHLLLPSIKIPSKRSDYLTYIFEIRQRMRSLKSTWLVDPILK